MHTRLYYTTIIPIIYTLWTVPRGFEHYGQKKLPSSLSVYGYAVSGLSGIFFGWKRTDQLFNLNKKKFIKKIQIRFFCHTHNLY